MEVIPAIDLRGGRCVRLYQGDFQKETAFSDDPVGVALRWQELGAPRIHVVDLDGALTGTPGNLEVIGRIAQRINIPLQVGGGIRTLDTASRVLELGVERVVLGTVAVEDPSLVDEACRRLGIKAVVIGVDAKGGRVQVKGWRETTGAKTTELVRQMASLGVERFVYTDVSRDGTLTEPNFDAIADLVAETKAHIVASGGISSIEHLRRLAQIGAEGAIVGIALYRGAIDLREAIGAVS